MSDEQNPESVPTGEAPADDGGSNDADDSVTLTMAQLKSIENSIWAKARKTFAGEKPAKQSQPSNDPRVQRGLELLARYERAHADEQNRLVEIQARADASPFQERVASALGRTKGTQPQQPAAQPAAQNDALSQLVELMKMDIASRMADKLPKAPITYANPMDALHAEINAQVAAIKDDPSLDERQRADRIRQAVSAKLKHVKIKPGGATPAWAQPQPPKK